MTRVPSLAEMTRAVDDHDPAYDGIFFTGVRTTGIFCRPSCPARTPLPRNREYFGTAQEALDAGYRPCKRCRPLHTEGQPPAWVQQLLAEVEQSPSGRLTAKELRARGIDPARASRYFKKRYHMTFQAYCRRYRMGKA